MNDLEQTGYVHDEPNKGIKKIFGISLLVVGVLVCIYILTVVIDLLNGGEYVGLVQSMVPADLATAASQDDSGLVLIARQSFVAFGFIVVIFLLSIAARLGIGLMRTGAGLLNADLATVTKQLRKELIKWRREEY
jgi:hypothetical protein